MKTIVVPTDFSKPAGDAAKYALHIAKYLKSNIKLCHAFMVPVDATVAGQVVWPLYNYESIFKDVSEELDVLAKDLMQESRELNFPNTFKPVVEHTAEPGGAVELINRLVKEEHAGLVVMGMSGAGAITKFFTGSVSRSLIENSTSPILLIPGGCEFKEVKKIAFATDLDKRDIEIIHTLVGFARHFNAELVVVHVDHDPKHYDAKKADRFLNEVTCKINYDKIYYREISSANVNDGLQWLSEHGWIDILVMVHRPHSFMDKLIRGSFTKKQAGSVKIPLLVLPEGLTAVL
ncbi:universal stress protein [Pedobacter frigoris]|uniref:universal stress protein n=1 Tax=Pedobacter frigoris TaxID=2571272 RepID=UPI00292E2A29|nr:universal stress protein [Pedobacter frigoris]